MSENFAVIMAGGIGSRFWPISRTDNPKQFLDIFTTPIGQFIAIFIINLAIHKKYNSFILFWVIIECVISVFFLQSLKYILRSIYSKPT